MDARDRLHAAAIAVREAEAIDRFRPADVRSAVAADRDQVIGGQVARHARAPKQLVADVLIDHLVDVRELLQAALDAGVGRGDQLELRLGKIGGDVRVRERRAERLRMQRLRQRAVGPHAQAFLLDAAADAAQPFRNQLHGEGEA